jgi:hypothetical protein
MLTPPDPADRALTTQASRRVRAVPETRASQTMNVSARIDAIRET